MSSTVEAPADQSVNAGIAVTATNSPRVRLDFLDGLRGLAALYVVMHHTWNEMGWHGRQALLPRPVQHVMSFFMPGSFAVAIFIVLSGYCLMLPVVRSNDLSLRGGTADYLKRRAHRILGPYYAALALSLLFIACFSDLRHPTGIQTQLALTTDRMNFLQALAAHLTLFHNLMQVWAFKFNSPMWSVATEWQIYFLFPWILLPIWRKFGLLATVAVGYGIGIAVHFVFHGYYDAAAPWFIGLFTMGMAGAAICFSSRPFETTLRTRVPWAAVTFGGTVALLAMVYKLEYGKHFQQMEMAVGLPALALLVYCALFRISNAKNDGPVILRLMESPLAVKLGAMSYSLYLTHVLVVEVVNAAILRTGVSPLSQILITLPLTTGLALILGYLFHLGIERRFMPGHLQRQAAALDTGVRG
jgi:peptidoglycan/LPS O-acetylase OafA/YrhL